MKTTEYIKFQIKKCEDYLEKQGYRTETIYFYVQRSDSFRESAAIVDKRAYDDLNRRYRHNSNMAMMYISHFIIDLETGELIKERFKLPTTPAEKVLYEAK